MAKQSGLVAYCYNKRGTRGVTLTKKGVETIRHDFIENFGNALGAIRSREFVSVALETNSLPTSDRGAAREPNRLDAASDAEGGFRRQ